MNDYAPEKRRCLYAIDCELYDPKRPLCDNTTHYRRGKYCEIYSVRFLKELIKK